MGNSLLESSHDLYWSPLHLVQLRSSCPRHVFVAWGSLGILSERDKRWWDAREWEKSWHRSISSLSEWQGWVPFNFLLVRYWNKWLCHCWLHQNISADSCGSLPLNCVPFIIFSLHQGSHIPVAGYYQCTNVYGVFVFKCMHMCTWFLLFLKDKLHNWNKEEMLQISLLDVSA